MAQRIELEVAPRTVMGKATKRLRKEGIIPGNIYGHKQEPVPVQVEAMAFDRLHREHGSRNVLSLRLPKGSAQTAIISHVQRGPLGHILHVDFTRVSLRERISTKVPLHFVGEAPGVKIQGGVFLPLVEALDVESAAADMVNAIEVDVSSLTDIGSTLRAKDITLPANYTLLIDPEEPIVKIDAPRVVAEPVAEEAATTTEAEPAKEE
ncbi:MAG TPA: 50S ribosomal protein L25 [Ktedonobacteraceae bacterium]|jgi:large subunit ribosomal protein L25|nr:50S ribosomal protein L25 [Ktedonobacteraceae bacterium]